MNKLKSYYLKYRLKLAAAITIVLAIVSVISLYITLEVNVVSNDECIWRATKVSQDSVKYIFESVKIEGVTWKAGIRNGDQLLKINNIKIYSDQQAQLILNKFKSGQDAGYVVKKPDGEILSTKVQIKKLVFFGNIAQSLSSLIWLLIGFIVFSAKPDGHPQKLFFALGVFIVLSSMNGLLPQIAGLIDFIHNYILLSFTIFTLVIIGQSFLPFVLLYFIWTFLKPFKFTELRWLKILFVIVPSIIALTALIILTNFYLGKINYQPEFGILTPILRILNYTVNFTALVSLCIIYFKEKNKENRKPILLIVVAFTFGFVVQFYVGTIAPAISDTIFNSPEYYMPVILIVLVPLTIAYAIFKYHLLDVSIVVRNTIIYGAATLTVAVIYFLVIYVMGQGISRVIGAENQGIIAGVFFIIFALVFQSTKDQFQNFLTKRFYPEQFAYQKVLVAFSNEVSTVVGLDNILDLTKNTFVDALKIDRFGIMVRDQNSGVLKLVRNIGFSKSDCIIEQAKIPQFLKERSLITKYPVIEQKDYATVFPEKSERLIMEQIFTIIPMIVKSKVIGLLMFGLKHSGSQFGGKDLELLCAASNQIGVAIENARLYESETEKLKIERDLDLARKIQQGLLPNCIPQLGGLDICGEMIPAMQVGGDYFDLIQISDTKLFVAVGDVSGKGLSASLYMTKLQTMVQLACNNISSPREILIEINKGLYKSMDRSWFITMTLALFDLEKHTVKLCRAGHMPLLAAYNGVVETIKTQGIGLGLEKGDIFDKALVEEELALKHGQIFAFFSDGITEAMNESDELFGEEKLTELLKGKTKYRSSEIMDNVWNAVKSFKASAQPNDDMTMVIVKVQSY